ncbi:MAG: ATP-binding protein, partial [Chloroflexia bacterium]|nr:ATP-binding protein [Chloroflexia bacterium]
SDADDLNTAMTRLRSFGIPGIYAHQTLSQLGDLADVMLVNAANRVILQTNEPDASRYARMYAAYGIEARDIVMQSSHHHHYAIFRSDGNDVGLLSMKPLIWPVSQEIPEIKDAGDVIASWQTILPEHHSSIDSLVVQLAYTNNLGEINLDQYIEMDEPTWNYWCERWICIRQYHREYILRHRQSISDQFSRQQWLSRLLIAHPRIFAIIAELRLLKQSNTGK